LKVKRLKVKVTGGGAYCGGLPHSLFDVLVQSDESDTASGITLAVIDF